MLIDALGNMLQVYVGPNWHIHDSGREIEIVCMNLGLHLQGKALATLRHSRKLDA